VRFTVLRIFLCTDDIKHAFNELNNNNNNNNNANICKAHTVSIRAESEAPLAIIISFCPQFSKLLRGCYKLTPTIRAKLGYSIPQRVDVYRGSQY